MRLSPRANVSDLRDDLLCLELFTLLLARIRHVPPSSDGTARRASRGSPGPAKSRQELHDLRNELKEARRAAARVYLLVGLALAAETYADVKAAVEIAGIDRPAKKAVCRDVGTILRGGTMCHIADVLPLEKQMMLFAATMTSPRAKMLLLVAGETSHGFIPEAELDRMVEDFAAREDPLYVRDDHSRIVGVVDKLVVERDGGSQPRLMATVIFHGAVPASAQIHPPMRATISTKAA